MSKFCAVLCSDLHLTLAAPSARAETDWLAVQRGYLRQLKLIREEAGNPPVLCGGDVFDKPNPPVELVNFALAELPDMYAVPGQHDLLHHSWKDLQKTAFWTLVEAGKIALIPPGKPTGVGSLHLHGFPWGFPPKPCEPHACLALEVAVIHRYVWTEETGYPDAPADCRLKKYWKNLKGYHVALFGDNHKEFLHHNYSDNGTVYNPGTFIRRKADERTHRPSVGLLRDDGSVERRYLNVEGDKWADRDNGAKVERDFSDLLIELGKSDQTPIDFVEAVKTILRRGKVSKRVRRQALRLLIGDVK